MIGPIAPHHTIFDQIELAHRIGEIWGMKGAPVCRLIARSVNDTYEISSGGERFVLRIYRRGWRNLQEIAFEFAVLELAAENNLPVALPVPDGQGRLVATIDAPEGDRYAVLFHYMDGAPPQLPADPDLYRRLGVLAGELHNAPIPPHLETGLRKIDIQTLVAEPARRILEYPRIPMELKPLLAETAELLIAAVGSQSDTWEQGICHGDLGLGNLHLDARGSISLLDFDCCGHGWLAYDLASFKWWAESQKVGQRAWKLLAEGYQSIRPLPIHNEFTVPLLMLARQFWVLDLEIALAPATGTGFLDTYAWTQMRQAVQCWSPAAGLEEVRAGQPNQFEKTGGPQ
jgi:Ser/Thr protein kinase RdoA (MazF antagonist)